MLRLLWLLLLLAAITAGAANAVFFSRCKVQFRGHPRALQQTAARHCVREPRLSNSFCHSQHRDQRCLHRSWPGPARLATVCMNARVTPRALIEGCSKMSSLQSSLTTCISSSRLLQAQSHGHKKDFLAARRESESFSRRVFTAALCRVLRFRCGHINT